MLIDTHAHLTDEKYSGANEIISGMEADGLKSIVTVGCDLATSVAAHDLAEANKNIYFTAGIHPSNTFDIESDAYVKILELSKSEKCVAIGEIGLDYHYDDTDKAIQKRELLKQLELVKAADLPVVFHLREAFDDFYDIVKNNLDKLPKRGIMHCFSGSLRAAHAFADLGFYISFSGNVTFKNAKEYPDIIKSLPREIILTETDCPYLAPDPFRGRLNYPAYVKYVAQKLAMIWQIDVLEAEEITLNNAYCALGKLRRD